MRPLRLEVEAFGPFATRQVIDFDLLADDGLFLLWGPTGAGKSFLLDALCFALYGRTAGDRPLSRLHSDHARDVEPRIELRFVMGGEEWVVTRTPPRWRTKRDGTPTQGSSKAVLARVVPGGTDVVAQKVAEVDRILRERIGLDAEEFRRVVVLPQGRFEQVLTATSAERERLLATIFSTHRFEQVAAHLADRETEAARAIEVADSEQSHRERAVVEAVTRLVPDRPPGRPVAAAVVEAFDGLRRLAAAVGAADRPSVDDLARCSSVLRATHEAISAETSSAAKAADSARSAADAASAQVKAWDRRAGLRTEQAELDGTRRDVEAARAALAASERAAHVVPLVRAERDSRIAHTAAVTARATAAAAVGEAWEASPVTLGPDLASRPPSNDDIVDAGDDWFDEVARAVVRRGSEVDSAAEAARRADEARAEREVVRRDLTIAEEARVRWAEQATAAANQVKAADEALTAAGLAAARLAPAEAEVGRRTAALVAARRLPDLDAAALAAERDEAARATEAADARGALADLRRAQLEGMAAELAGTLVDGEACPVCGADEHPDPARPASDAPDPEDLERAETLVEQADEAREAARRAVVEARTTRAEVAARAGDAATDPEAAEVELAELSARAAADAELAGSLTVHEQARADAALAVDGCTERAEAARSDAERLRSRSAALDESIATRAAVADAVLGTGAGTVEASRATAALTALHDALSGLATARATVRQAAAAADVARGAMAEALSRSGFADGAEAEAALLGDAQAVRLRRDVDAWEDGWARIVAGLDHPDLADLPDERPDADTPTAEAEVARRAHQHLVEVRARVSAAADEVARIVAEHSADAERLVIATAEHEVRRRLAELCRGRGDDKVSLQRWVLASHLQTICERANQRLAVMSGGRYSLIVHTESSRGARAGLDLKVADAHNGEEREVTTLSGGETFQASLALALGVADVVKERAGGIELDVLFVDEGFGTLDPDALDLALDELDRLRAAGRMVGVVSHVAGLRERIGAGIEVRRNRGGSEVVVGVASA